MLRLQTGRIAAAVVAVAAMILIPSTALAGDTDFSIFGPTWQQSWDGTPCGPNTVKSAGIAPEMFKDAAYMGCSIGWFPTSAVTSHPGWESTLVDAANLDSIRDTEFNNRIIFHYFENTGNDAVTVDAQDLGGPDSQGRIVVGNGGPIAVNGIIISGTATMSTNGNISWNVYSLCSCAPNQFEVDLMTVGEHELGHVLGLAHPTVGATSTNPAGVDNVMECVFGQGQQLFSDPYTDNGIKYLYDWDAVTPQPVPSPC